LSPSRCAGHPLANVLFQLAANGRAIRGILRRVAIAAHRALGDVGGIDRFAVVFELFDDGACEALSMRSARARLSEFIGILGCLYVS